MARPGFPSVTRNGADPAATRQDEGGLLPIPPDDVEKYSYARRGTRAMAIFSICSFFLVAYTQVLLTRLSPWMWSYVPFLAFTIVYILVSQISTILTRDFDLAAHQKLVDTWQPETYPAVDVMLPVCGEPDAVLRNTWEHVAALRDNYPGTVTAYVLDDSSSPRLQRMAGEFGFVYAGRANRGWYKKAGNLLYGYRISHAPYMMVLDADFCPRTDFLHEVLPHLEADPTLGIVQTPQFFRVLDQQSWLERGAGAVQELFYRSVQTSQSTWDGAVCVGSCAVYRRAAIEDNGGMTLIEHSEDLHTGFDLYLRGWHLRYLPIALSAGVCPDNISAYVNQQYRWCSGTMSMLGSRKFWRTKLPLRTRTCYLSGFFYYVHTALSTFFFPLVPIAMLLFWPQAIQFKTLVWVLPGLLYTGVLFPLWHRSPYRLEANACRMIYNWAHVFTIWDVLRKRQQGWQPSGSSAKKQGRNRRFWIGMVGWTSLTAAVWIGADLWRMKESSPIDFSVFLASGLFYAATAARVFVQPKGAGS
jgi:cellulose synthase (UDP-forming)